MTALPLLFYPGKHPADVSDFSIDFAHLLARGEHILSATVVASPAGLTLSTPTIAKGVVTTYIGGGTSGVSYEISYTFVTDRQTDTRSAILNCQDL